MPKRLLREPVWRVPRPRRVARLRALPTYTRGPRGLQRSQIGVRHLAYPPPPPGWGNKAVTEWAVWWALTVPLKKVPDVDFSYQDPFAGGRSQFGGLVVDFLMLDGSNIAMNPIGRYFHVEAGASKQALDQAQRAYLLGLGITLIFLDEQDTLANPLLVVEAALQGIDRSEVGRGAV